MKRTCSWRRRLEGTKPVEAFRLVCATFSPSFRHKFPLWWNHATPSWSMNQPIGDKKSAWRIRFDVRFDIRFLSSLSIIHVLTSGPKFHCTKSHALEISPFALMPARISRVNVRKHSVGLRTIRNRIFTRLHFMHFIWVSVYLARKE